MIHGQKYPFIENILTQYSKNAHRVLEIGAGSNVYKNIFKSHIASDLPDTSYFDKISPIDVFCDGQQLPFKKKSFDLVYLIACLYQIPDTRKVLSECHRILNENGRILIFDYNKKTTIKLHKTEGDGNNNNHIWSPFKLFSIVRKCNFSTKIITDYYLFHNNNRFRSLLSKIPLVSFIRFLILQNTQGWNIIFGIKR